MNMNKKVSYLFLSLGTALILSACQTQKARDTTVQNKPDIVEETAVLELDKPIDVYCGPGTDYLPLGTIGRMTIEKAVKIEDDWVEVEFEGKRGYVPKDDVSELCSDKTPRLVDDIGSYPVKINTQIELFEDVTSYALPTRESSSELINAGETVTIVSVEMSPMDVYLQIELDKDGSKKRCYAVLTELLSMKNPLINFDSVKEANAQITYDGTDYYSSSGEIASASSITSGWKKTDEIVIEVPNWEASSEIADVIKSYHVNDMALDGKFKMNLYENRQYMNASAKDKLPSSMHDVINVLLENKISFAQGANNTLQLKIELQELEGEHKIVIKAGNPIEFSQTGTIPLRSFIENTLSLSEDDAAKKEDEIIKSIYPVFMLEQNKTYHMDITFTNDLNETDSGYYLVIDKQLHVYAVPIIHGDTALKIYSEEDLYSGDAALELASSMIQLDDESAAKILDLLTEKGFTIQGN